MGLFLGGSRSLRGGRMGKGGGGKVISATTNYHDTWVCGIVVRCMLYIAVPFLYLRLLCKRGYSGVGWMDLGLSPSHANAEALITHRR